MSDRRPSSGSESSEEERAFLQTRVALFWKVLFFIVLIGSALGILGAVKKPGLDLVLSLSFTAQAGFFWWLCRRGVRSIGFSRAVESGGLLLFSIFGVLLSRYILAGFVGEHAVLGAQAQVMADAYVSMMQVAGTAPQIAIRAALIPSRPRRTVILTGLFGAPMIAVNSLVVPTADGGLALRALDSEAFPWMPMTMVMMWGFVTIACTVISWVIYGLRAEVREARRLGQYVLEEKLGEGGMGVVYRASHAMLRRPTAIKLLLPDRAGQDALVRFEREVRRTAMLTHPNTVTVFDYGRTTDGVFYYAMELLEGAALDELVQVCGPQPDERVIHLLDQVAGSLAEAHDAGLIHRDVKPGNIVVVDRGGISDLVKVLDFGLVKDVGFKARGEAPSQAALTVAGTITGTPLYIAPETLTAPDTVDARADLYALGAVGYWLLTGTHVFGDHTIFEVCAHHLHSVPEPPSARLPGPVAPDLEAVLLACLSKRPEDRPASAHVLRERLQACAGAGRWTNARAAQWWALHRRELRSGGAGVRAADPADVRAPHLTVNRLLG
jgi:hypothetical protein